MNMLRAFSAGLIALTMICPAISHAQDVTPDVTKTPESKPKPSATKDGFTIRPRARLQVDIGTARLPGGQTVGVTQEVRRAWFGFEGRLGGKFGYRLDADFAPHKVELIDAYVNYKTGKTTITVGQQKTFQGLDDMTNDLFSNFQERPAFSRAFGFERRIGISAVHAGGDIVLQGGVFHDNALDLGADNKSSSLDGRFIYSPKIAGAQWHFGASAHVRDLNGLPNTVRYRPSAFVRATQLRLTDTRVFSATGERYFGLESAYIKGPFHAEAEGMWFKPVRSGLVDPTFFGGYGEVGYFLTKGDTIGYRGGAFDAIKPKRPLGSGGFGAVQLTVRYDYLDLTSAGINGGRQGILGTSLIWVPQERVRFTINYGRTEVRDAAVLQGGSRNYGVDSFGARMQFHY